MDRRQHRERALVELFARLDVAVGGVADHPGRAPSLRLLVDERAGVLAVVLVSRRERDRGQERRLGIGGGVELVAGEGAGGAAAGVAHLGILGGDDPAAPAAAAGARELAVARLELLADDLAQEARRRRDALVAARLAVLLDRPQRPRGVERQLAQELHPRGLVPPVAARLSARLSAVEAQPAESPSAASGSAASTASISLRSAERTGVAVSWTAAAPGIGVESRICSAGPEIGPSSVASSSERSNTSRSLPCSSSRARKRTNELE